MEGCPGFLGLAKEQFIVSLDEELSKRPHQLKATSLVETTGTRIERGHADEHVRAVAEDSFLGPAQQCRSKPPSATIRPDAKYLHVAA